MVEGPTLVQEAVEAGVRVLEQYVRDDYDGYEVPGLPAHEVEAHVFNSVADTETPRGILAVCEMPASTPLSTHSDAWYLVLHEVSDPGNLGTLMRSSEAAGASGVVLSGSTVDPWSPKVVRASAGAVFHVPVWKFSELSDVKQEGIRLLGTTSHDDVAGAPTSLYDSDVTGCLGVVLGNEAHGLHPDAPVDGWITIPHVGRSESLNVAMAGTVIAMHVSHAREGK